MSASRTPRCQARNLRRLRRSLRSISSTRKRPRWKSRRLRWAAVGLSLSPCQRKLGSYFFFAFFAPSRERKRKLVSREGAKDAKEEGKEMRFQLSLERRSGADQ